MGHSGPGSDDNKWVLLIPKAPASLDCFVSYPEQSLGEFYFSAEMQSGYSAAPADWATGKETVPGAAICKEGHAESVF